MICQTLVLVLWLSVWPAQSGEGPPVAGKPVGREPVVTEPSYEEPTPPATALKPASLSMLPALIDVQIRLDRTTVPVGSEVMGEFIVRNRTLEPVVLQVPNVETNGETLLWSGLPLEHVFSGERFRALRIVSEGNASLGDRRSERPDAPLPLLTLAPSSVVGLRVDLAKLYPVLHQAGRYELTWSPYAGAISSPTVMLEVISYKMVSLDTTMGRMSIRLFYDRAPATVANFLDLVRSRFYDGKLLHRIERDFAIAGGCPVGDGTGRRPDGRTVPAEFNETPFTAGTLGMSLAPGDVNSASCQFFISLSRNEALDGRYTAFGQIEGPESLETLRRIASVETDAQKRPVQPVKINSAIVLDAASTR